MCSHARACVSMPVMSSSLHTLFCPVSRPPSTSPCHVVVDVCLNTVSLPSLYFMYAEFLETVFADAERVLLRTPENTQNYALLKARTLSMKDVPVIFGATKILFAMRRLVAELTGLFQVQEVLFCASSNHGEAIGKMYEYAASMASNPEMYLYDQLEPWPCPVVFDLIADPDIQPHVIRVDTTAQPPQITYHTLLIKQLTHCDHVVAHTVALTRQGKRVVMCNPSLRTETLVALALCTEKRRAFAVSHNGQYRFVPEPAHLRTASQIVQMCRKLGHRGQVLPLQFYICILVCALVGDMRLSCEGCTIAHATVPSFQSLLTTFIAHFGMISKTIQVENGAFRVDRDTFVQMASAAGMQSCTRSFWTEHARAARLLPEKTTVVTRFVGGSRRRLTVHGLRACIGNADDVALKISRHSSLSVCMFERACREALDTIYNPDE